MALIGKIFQALHRTRESVSNAFDKVIQRKVSPESLEELENTLISADMGVATVQAILKVVEKHRKDNLIHKVSDYLIKSGNERVVNARLSDAQFFWEKNKSNNLL